MTKPTFSQRTVSLLLKTLLLHLVNPAHSEQCPLDNGFAQVCTSCVKRDEGWVINCANAQLSQFPPISSSAEISLLNLEFNQLTEITSDQTSSLSIKELYLGSNQLTSTEFLAQDGRLSNTLKHLKLDRNRGISMHSAHFSSLRKLSMLSLEGSELSNLGFLRNNTNHNHLNSLERLFVKNNQLTSVDLKVFENKTHLEHLDLSANLISGTQFLQTPSLHRLEQLELQRNLIDVLPAEHFRYLTSLTNVNIRDNLLAVLDIEVLVNLPSLQVFDWGLNPAVCTCSLAWLNTWQVDNPNITVVNPSGLDSCVYPAGICPTEVTPVQPLFTSTFMTFSTTEATSVASLLPTGRSTPLTTTTTSAGLSQDVIIIIAVVAAALLVAGVSVVVGLVLRKGRSRRGTPFKPPPSHQSLSPLSKFYKGGQNDDTQCGMSVRSHEYAYIDETRRDFNNRETVDRPLPKSPTDSDGYLISVSRPTTSSEDNAEYELANDDKALNKHISNEPSAGSSVPHADNKTYAQARRKEEYNADNDGYIDCILPEEDNYTSPTHTEEGVYQEPSTQNSVRIYQQILPVQCTEGGSF